MGERLLNTAEVLSSQVKFLPENLKPIVVAGGSFNNADRLTTVTEEQKEYIDALLTKTNPKKEYFVIGPTLSAYEKYLWEKAKDKYKVVAFVPAQISTRECEKLKSSGLDIRVAIESSLMGLYKSIAYEIYKRGEATTILLDGNSPAANLIQEAKNSKYKQRIYVSSHSRGLKTKAESLT